MSDRKITNGAHKALVDVTVISRELIEDDVISKNVTIKKEDEIFVRGIGISGDVSAHNMGNPKEHYTFPLQTYFAAFEAIY